MFTCKCLFIICGTQIKQYKHAEIHLKVINKEPKPTKIAPPPFLKRKSRYIYISKYYCTNKYTLNCQLPTEPSETSHDLLVRNVLSLQHCCVALFLGKLF